MFENEGSAVCPGTSVHVRECGLCVCVAAGPPCSYDHTGRVLFKSLESAGLCSNAAFVTLLEILHGALGSDSDSGWGSKMRSFFFFFDGDHFKVSIEFVTILLLFLCFGFWARRQVGG